MDRNFNRAVTATLKYEGGYVNHPSDPGGATNLGVTIATFRRYIKPSGTIADLKALTVDQAKTVYRRQYWDAVSGAELPDGVDFAVFDFGVNSGTSRAIKYLQRIVGVAQDGRIGPATLKAVRAIPHAKLIHDICDERLAFMKRAKDKKGRLLWPTFKNGWSSRMVEVRSLALQMASAKGWEPMPSFVPIPNSSPVKPIETRPEITLPPVNPPALKMNWFKLIWTALTAVFSRR